MECVGLLTGLHEDSPRGANGRERRETEKEGGREAGRPIPQGMAAASRYRMAADAIALGMWGKKRSGKAASSRAASGVDGTRLLR